MGAPAVARLVGYAGNLIADGNHARADAYVWLAVIASALVEAIGLRIAELSSDSGSPW